LKWCAWFIYFDKELVKRDY